MSNSYLCEVLLQGRYSENLPLSFFCSRRIITSAKMQEFKNKNELDLTKMSVSVKSDEKLVVFAHSAGGAK